NGLLCHSWLGDPATFDTATAAIETVIAIQAGGISMNGEDVVVLRDSLSDAKHFQPTLTEWMRQPPNPQVSYNFDLALLIAGSHLADGKHALAADIATWVLQTMPDHPRARAILGMTHLNAMRYAESLKEFDAALARDANNVLALTGRALALEQSGDAVKALDAFGKLVREHEQPTGPLPLIGLLGKARAFAKLGKEVETRHLLERAREVDPVAADKLAAKLFPGAR
ncbi:MAG: hypothetical protein C0467_31960, partial [Planctomycetaceae bacterium]|nr:hypothetical protein [Planctomycetaceae bacterium]